MCATTSVTVCRPADRGSILPCTLIADVMIPRQVSGLLAVRVKAALMRLSMLSETPLFGVLQDSPIGPRLPAGDLLRSQRSR